MAKVTYLFGAGASCNCLPLVKDIPDAIDKFRQEIVHYHPEPDEIFPKLSSHTVEQGKAIFLAECERFHEMVKSHASVDTYAKKLWITDNMPDYKSLKVILSFLFIYLQLEKEVDYRYDSFFASILGNSSDDFNGNIKILSWNYDFQFEKAYSKFSQTNDLKQNQLRLLVCPDGIHPEHYRATDKFNIFKINGTTSFFNNATYPPNFDPITSFEPFNKIELLKQCIFYYLISVKRPDLSIISRLNFAWESYPAPYNDHNNIIDTAKKAVVNSDAIVVIGYSFPFFNRVIDRLLITSACANRVTKFYIQDVYPERIITKLSSFLPYDYPKQNIIPIETLLDDRKGGNKDQFFLPPEL